MLIGESIPRRAPIVQFPETNLDRPIDNTVSRNLATGVGLLASIATGLTVTAFNRVAVVAMHALVARKLGRIDDYGVFALCLGAIVLLALFSGLGWHQIITRLTAQYIQNEDWQRLRGALNMSMIVTLGTGAVLAAAVLLASLLVANSAEIASCWQIVAICVPLYGQKKLRFSQLQGLHRTKAALFLDEGIVPTVVVLYSLAFGLESVNEALVVYAASTLLSVVFATWMFQQSLPRHVRTAVPRYELAAWFSSAWPAIFARSGIIVMQRADLLMIAPLLGTAAVGMYSIAAKIAVALAMVPLGIGAVMRPKFATAHYAGDRQRLKSLFMQSMVISTVLSFPIGVVLLLCPGQITELLFGTAYGEVVLPLRILLLGHAINAATGPVTAYLMMTERERCVGGTSGLGALVNVIGNLIAIPLAGILGAAAATSTGMALRNGWQLRVCLQQLRGNGNATQ